MMKSQPNGWLFIVYIGLDFANLAFFNKRDFGLNIRIFLSGFAVSGNFAKFAAEVGFKLRIIWITVSFWNSGLCPHSSLIYGMLWLL